MAAAGFNSELISQTGDIDSIEMTKNSVVFARHKTQDTSFIEGKKSELGSRM